MSLSRTAFQAPRKFKIHQAHRDERVGEHTFTLKSWGVPGMFFPNCETPKISFCREDTIVDYREFLHGSGVPQV